MFTNFHFLLYLLTNDVVPFNAEEVEELSKMVVARDATGASDWRKSNANWATLVQLLGEEPGELTVTPDDKYQSL